MNSKKLRHIVLFSFVKDTNETILDNVIQSFHQLEKLIDCVESIESGTNCSPENLNKGLTHCFLVTFKDEKDRDEYLVHPDHLKFVELIKPILEDVCVVDYLIA